MGMSRAIVCMLPQIPTDFVQERWPCLRSTHHFLALPITTESTQWKPHSLKSEIISFLVWQPALLPYFPWVNCHFQYMQHYCCDIVHRVPPRQEPGFLLHQNLFYFFPKKKCNLLLHKLQTKSWWVNWNYISINQNSCYLYQWQILGTEE